MEKKRRVVPLRLNVQDKVLLVWKHLLTVSVSRIVKSILYSYKNNLPFPQYELKQIPLDESMFKAMNINISFSNNEVDVALYDYLLSDECNPPKSVYEDMYLNAIGTSQISSKVKNLIFLSIPDDITNDIKQAIKQFYREQYVNVKDTSMKNNISTYNSKETENNTVNNHIETEEVASSQTDNITETNVKKTVTNESTENTAKDIDNEDVVSTNDVELENNTSIDIENNEDNAKETVETIESSNSVKIESHTKKRRRKGAPKQVAIPNIAFDSESMTESLKAMNEQNN